MTDHPPLHTADFIKAGTRTPGEDEFNPFDPGNYVTVEIAICLPCDADQHHGCYGVLCECDCGGEQVG